MKTELPTDFLNSASSWWRCLTGQSTWAQGWFTGDCSKARTPLLVSLPRIDLRWVKCVCVCVFLWRGVFQLHQGALTLLCLWQWIIGELACYTYSMVAVPLYDTLGPEALVFIIDRGNWSFFNAANCRARSESKDLQVSKGIDINCAVISPLLFNIHSLQFYFIWSLGTTVGVTLLIWFL